MHFVGTSDDDDNDDDHHDHDHDHNDDHDYDDHGHDDNNDGNGGGDDSVSWMGMGMHLILGDGQTFKRGVVKKGGVKYNEGIRPLCPLCFIPWTLLPQWSEFFKIQIPNIS